jgi:hypothetical protein
VEPKPSRAHLGPFTRWILNRPVRDLFVDAGTCGHGNYYYERIADCTCCGKLSGNGMDTIHHSKGCASCQSKMKSFLDSEPIQGVFESYSGRCWKAWEYRRWVEEGLIGEIEDPFEAVRWQQGGVFAQTQRSLESKSRAAQVLRTEEKLVSCRSRADP